MEHGRKSCIRVGTFIIDECTHVRWKYASFIQQVRPCAWVASGQLMQHLTQCDRVGIELYRNNRLPNDDARCSIECYTHTHASTYLSREEAVLSLSCEARTIQLAALQTVLLANVGTNADCIEFVQRDKHV